MPTAPAVWDTPSPAVQQPSPAPRAALVGGRRTSPAVRGAPPLESDPGRMTAPQPRRGSAGQHRRPCDQGERGVRGRGPRVLVSYPHSLLPLCNDLAREWCVNTAVLRVAGAETSLPAGGRAPRGREAAARGGRLPGPSLCCSSLHPQTVPSSPASAALGASAPSALGAPRAAAPEGRLLLTLPPASSTHAPRHHVGPTPPAHSPWRPLSPPRALIPAPAPEAASRAELLPPPRPRAPCPARPP